MISHLGPAAVRDPLDALDLLAIERPAESPKPVGIADASFNAEPDRDMAGPAYPSPARRRRCESPQPPHRRHQCRIVTRRS
ncbi:hypothetical protein DIE08_10465 [Burkholderia sp. Bp9004]|nr:hypothetical protein DIE08_10465 [Burkholderia sp. Bp9004]